MTVIVVTGNPRSGKTTVLTYFGKPYADKGWDVLSNYILGYPHELIDLEEVAEWQERDIQLVDKCLILDEVHLWADARKSMSKVNRVMSYFGYQAGKRNVDFLMSTHRTRMVDWRLIDVVDMAIDCSMIVKDQYGVRWVWDQNSNYAIQPAVIDGTLEPYVLMDILDVHTEARSIKELWARPIFPLFDTRELLGLTQTV